MFVHLSIHLFTLHVHPSTHIHLILFMHLSTNHSSHPPSLLCNPTLHSSLNYSMFLFTFTSSPSYSSFISQLFIVLIHLHFSQSYSSFISQRYSSFSSNFTSSQSYSSFISQLFILLIYLHFFTINPSFISQLFILLSTFIYLPSYS